MPLTPLSTPAPAFPYTGTQLWEAINAAIDAEVTNLGNQVFDKTEIGDLLGEGIGRGSVSGTDTYDPSGSRFGFYQADLIGNLTLTLLNLPVPFFGLLLLTQDSVGGRSLTVSWGGTADITSVYLDPTPGASTMVFVSHPAPGELFVSGPNDIPVTTQVGARETYYAALATEQTTTSSTPQSLALPSLSIATVDNSLALIYLEAEGKIDATAAAQKAQLRLSETSLNARQTTAGGTSPPQVLEWATTTYTRRGIETTVATGSSVFFNNSPFALPLDAGTHVFQPQLVSSDNATIARVRNLRMWIEVQHP